jgi:hypothetical protein
MQPRPTIAFVLRSLLGATLIALLASIGVAQNYYAKWIPTFGKPGDFVGIYGTVNAFTVYDDGTGPALIVGGRFTQAGGVVTHNIAKWNGYYWSALGSGVGTLSGEYVSALAVYNEPSGPKLYVGGLFNSAGGAPASGIARWNGASWSTPGSGASGTFSPCVSALTVHNEGKIPALYAGGNFTLMSGIVSNGIAKWDGKDWYALKGGVDTCFVTSLVSGTVGKETVPSLYVGGTFTQVGGGLTAPHVAKWANTNWYVVGTGTDGDVLALAILNKALYLGGVFTVAGPYTANGIARWNGSTWSGMSGGVGWGGSVNALAVYDEGNGPVLFVGGLFSFPDGSGAYSNYVARWTGKEWSFVPYGTTGVVGALGVFDSGRGPSLYVGGNFPQVAGLNVNNIARWKRGTWSALSHAVNGTVNALEVFDDGTGSGPSLYAAGNLTSAGAVPVNRIAKWNGEFWTALDAGTNGQIKALKVFDDGSGPGLYAAGDFTTAGPTPAMHIAKWSGYSWSSLGSGLGLPGDTVNALCVYGDGYGLKLYAGGRFTKAGGIVVNNIAKWDGWSWSGIQFGISGAQGPQSAVVNGLTVFDNWWESSLIVCGTFVQAGYSFANSIAEWNGNYWSPLGNGILSSGQFVGTAKGVAVYDDGYGPCVYAGGDFVQAGNVGSHGIARWDTVDWYDVQSTYYDYPSGAFGVYDDGTGPALFMGGNFGSSGFGGVKKWQGMGWINIVSSVPYGASMKAFATYDAGHGPALFMGGDFTTSTRGDQFLAMYK